MHARFRPKTDFSFNYPSPGVTQTYRVPTSPGGYGKRYGAFLGLHLASPEGANVLMFRATARALTGQTHHRPPITQETSALPDILVLGSTWRPQTKLTLIEHNFGRINNLFIRQNEEDNHNMLSEGFSTVNIEPR